MHLNFEFEFCTCQSKKIPKIWTRILRSKFRIDSRGIRNGLVVCQFSGELITTNLPDKLKLPRTKHSFGQDIPFAALDCIRWTTTRNRSEFGTFPLLHGPFHIGIHNNACSSLAYNSKTFVRNKSYTHETDKHDCSPAAILEANQDFLDHQFTVRLPASAQCTINVLRHKKMNCIKL